MFQPIRNKCLSAILNQLPSSAEFSAGAILVSRLVRCLEAYILLYPYLIFNFYCTLVSDICSLSTLPNAFSLRLVFHFLLRWEIIFVFISDHILWINCNCNTSYDVVEKLAKLMRDYLWCRTVTRRTGRWVRPACWMGFWGEESENVNNRVYEEDVPGKGPGFGKMNLLVYRGLIWWRRRRRPLREGRLRTTSPWQDGPLSASGTRR